MTDELKQAIEAIKLRTPIEEVVRERVSGLKRTGALWQACCPFHDERTPSFKVSPQRGYWRCYGACNKGGDVIDFIVEFDHLSFIEAVELLASRAGVELPRRAGPSERGANERLYAVLERAEKFYARMLRAPEGAAALAYLRGRGLSEVTLEAFGYGYAPSSGTALLRKALDSGHTLADLVAVGLVRESDNGSPYDFFRGRVMVPIRDMQGRTVGFGARRLDDSDPRNPKYINTPETALFKKSRLIYALDLALESVRKTKQLIVMEGYTDVCAAHQVGLRNVVAVLGTATTEEHAALVRRTGARRVTLCFDGDNAGAQATLRALTGLLPLELEIDVVRLPDEADPCELLIEQGAAALERELAQSQGWFEFLLGTLAGLTGAQRFAAIDVVLEAIGRLKNPLHVETRLKELAASEGHPVEAVRAQFESLPARRREALRRENEQRERARAAAAAPDPARAPRLRAWREIAGALLLEPALITEARAWIDACEDPELLHLMERLSELGGASGVDAVLSALGDDPVRHHVVPLLELAMTAESPRALFNGACAFLERTREERAIDEQARRTVATADEGQAKQELAELYEALRRSKVQQASR